VIRGRESAAYETLHFRPVLSPSTNGSPTGGTAIRPHTQLRHISKCSATFPYRVAHNDNVGVDDCKPREPPPGKRTL